MDGTRNLFICLTTALVLAGCGGDDSSPLPSLPVTPFGVSEAASGVASSGQPEQTCSVQSATASADGANTAATCVTNPVRFAYVVNKDSNDISAYTMDTVTGALTAVSGSPFAAGTGPLSLAITPSDQFAYASNGTSYDISAYSIDPTTGALAPISGSPFAVTPVESTSQPLTPVVIDPSGQLALVANPRAPITTDPTSRQPDNLHAFQINSTTGALNAASGSPYETGGKYPRVLKMDSSGKFVYIMNTFFQGSSFGNLSAFAVNANAGTLTAVSGTPMMAGRLPEMFFLHPSNRFGYANYLTSGLWEFSLDPTTGTPTKTGQLHLDQLAREPVFDPSGRFLYLAPAYQDQIMVYRVDQTTGVLTFLSETLFAQPGGIYTLLMHPSGKYLYASSADTSTVYAFAIDSVTGALTPVSGSPYSLGIGVKPLWAVMDPSAQFLYTSNALSSDITTFRIDASTGVLTLIANSPVATGANPGPLTFAHSTH